MRRQLSYIYNKYKEAIWFTIIALGLAYLVMYNISKGSSNNSNSSSSNNTTAITKNVAINNSDNYINSSNVIENTVNNNTNNITKNTVIDSSSSAIKVFVDYCNEGKTSEAYAMLSDSCKKALYNDEKAFVNTYYNNYFKTQKQVSINTYKDNTYKVDYTQDSILTGKTNNDDAITDYITVNQDYNQYTLNICNFIKTKTINKTEKNDYIEVTILEKNIFYDYELYKVNIKNICKGNISLDDFNNSNMYITDKNNNKTKINISEYASEDIKIYANKEKNINLKFNKIYMSNNDATKINFDNIKIENQKYYEENTKNDNEQLSEYEQKMTQYPTKTTLEINLE